MRYKQPILKLASILLILVLTQKMVGGLYLHNWLHVSKTNIVHTSGGKTISQYNCSCIDDFYVPFTEPSPVIIVIPLPERGDYFAIPKMALPVKPRFSPSLRGPPVI
jgi:hypothetical protein